MLDQASSARSSERELAFSICQLVWANLPLLVFMDLVLAFAAIPSLALFLGPAPLGAPIVAAMTVGPIWAGIAATADAMLDGQRATPVTFARSVRLHVHSGMAVSLLIALSATLMIGTLAVFARHPEQSWLLVPLGIGTSIAFAVLIAVPAAFSLATTGGLSAPILWAASLGVVAGSPRTCLAVLILLALLVGWSGPGLLPVLPAPLAVFFSATTWAAVRSHPHRVTRTFIQE